MPIYEYQCQGCSGNFEELIRSSSDETNLRCPRCGNAEIKRTVSLFGFNAKGSSNQANQTTGHSAGHSCSGCHSHNCGHCH